LNPGAQVPTQQRQPGNVALDACREQMFSSIERDADLIRQQRRSPGAPIATVKF
jgi:hypothetical protein